MTMEPERYIIPDQGYLATERKKERKNWDDLICSMGELILLQPFWLRVSCRVYSCCFYSSFELMKGQGQGKPSRAITDDFHHNPTPSRNQGLQDYLIQLHQSRRQKRHTYRRALIPTDTGMCKVWPSDPLNIICACEYACDTRVARMVNTMLCLLRRPIPIVNVEGVTVITQSAGFVQVMV